MKNRRSARLHHHVSFKPFKFRQLHPEQAGKLVLHRRCVTYNLVLLRKFLPVQAQITQPVAVQQRWPLSSCKQQGRRQVLPPYSIFTSALPLGIITSPVKVRNFKGDGWSTNGEPYSDSCFFPYDGGCRTLVDLVDLQVDTVHPHSHFPRWSTSARGDGKHEHQTDICRVPFV